MTELSVNKSLLGLHDVNVHVEDTGGTGRPVILIHGWPLSGASWKKQISALREAGYRVITYDRRGFGQSDKPKTGYGYDTLAEDLKGVITGLGVTNVTLVGFSMGGGEVARYIAKYGEDGIHSVVFAAAVPPKLMNTLDNPEGPLHASEAAKMSAALTANADSFYDDFTKKFFSPNADGNIVVTEEERQEAVALCHQADKVAALEAMQSFGLADFRKDLLKITVPTLVIHGDADGIVPFEGSGKRTRETVPQSQLHIIQGGPHGINVSHTEEFNKNLIEFLAQ